MAKVTAWKKGRGKLGVLDPLLGTWRAEADTPMGSVACSRAFARTLGGSYVRLVARWEFAKGVYEEIAIIGAPGGELGFWSFTSDGKRSEGKLADATDIHPQAVGFEAQMPAGLARLVYWPDGDNGFHWAVESKNAKGWKRFTEHHYRPAPPAAGADEPTDD
jgi:hypothetical protein